MRYKGNTYIHDWCFAPLKDERTTPTMVKQKPATKVALTQRLEKEQAVSIAPSDKNKRFHSSQNTVWILEHHSKTKEKEIYSMEER